MTPAANTIRCVRVKRGAECLLKDLKHLNYFENLLPEANNELIRQAQE